MECMSDGSSHAHEYTKLYPKDNVNESVNRKS